MGAMTKKMNEVFMAQLDKEKELFSTENAIDLIKTINPINPIFYYHRLIAELFPDSEFSELVKDDYSLTSRVIISKRNELIRQAINENLGSNSITISPDIEFGDVNDTLTRNDKSHGIAATGLTREKCFLAAFVFNLTFEQMERLMFHCLGHSNINYKNPYEAMLVYCTLEHTRVYEHYLELKHMYESKSASAQIPKTELETQEYKNFFSEIDTDEKFVEFLFTLPNSDSTSARKVFTQIYNEIAEYLKEEADDITRDEIFNSFKEKGVYWSFEKLEKTKKYQKQIKSLINHCDVVNSLFGEVQKKSGSFAWLKKGTIFNASELKDMLSGKKAITKDHILLLLFYKFYLCGSWIDFVEDFEENLMPPDEVLSRLYYIFAQECNGYLRNAGFSDCYLPDALTRVLIFCLLTEEPIATFKMIMSDD